MTVSIQANCGWPGCTGDSYVLQNSGIWAALERGELLKPGLRIGLDSAYPLRFWSATPFKPARNRLESTHNTSLSQSRTRPEQVWARFDVLFVFERFV